MANRNIFNLATYGLSCVAGVGSWVYYQNQNQNLTLEEKYEKFGGDKTQLAEERVRNALMYKKIRERAGIKEEELKLPKPEAPPKILRMEGRKNEDVLAERKKLMKETSETPTVMESSKNDEAEEVVVKKVKKKKKKKIVKEEVEPPVGDKEKMADEAS